jgi:hypothetical protein
VSQMQLVLIWTYPPLPMRSICISPLAALCGLERGLLGMVGDAQPLQVRLVVGSTFAQGNDVIPFLDH